MQHQSKSNSAGETPGLGRTGFQWSHWSKLDTYSLKDLQVSPLSKSVFEVLGHFVFGYVAGGGEWMCSKCLILDFLLNRAGLRGSVDLEK